MLNKISLSGLAGSGKTTIGQLLAEILKYQFISIGNYSRDFAEKKYSMNINDFQVLCKEKPEIDIEIDSEFSNRINTSTNMVVDYRLAHILIKNCFHVYLDVSEQEAINRLKKANRKSEFKDNDDIFIRSTMNSRNNQMKQRFIQVYNSDFTDKSNYDLVVNTDEYTDFMQIVNLITLHYKNAQIL